MTGHLYDLNYTLRYEALVAISAIKHDQLDPKTLQKLISMLTNDDESSIQEEAAMILANVATMPARLKQADLVVILDGLITALQLIDQIYNQQSDVVARQRLMEVSRHIGKALAELAQGLPRRVSQHQLSYDAANNAIQQSLQAVRDSPSLAYRTENITTLEAARRELTLTKDRDDSWEKRIINNPFYWLGFVGLSTIVGIFAFRPLWLLKLDDIQIILKNLGEGNHTLAACLNLVRLPIMACQPLMYHPRVLDAWVTKNLR